MSDLTSIGKTQTLKWRVNPDANDNIYDNARSILESREVLDR